MSEQIEYVVLRKYETTIEGEPVPGWLEVGTFKAAKAEDAIAKGFEGLEPDGPVTLAAISKRNWQERTAEIERTLKLT